jgi:perosamine synthetase
MTNIQAAILLGQLESIDSIFNNKKRIFERYKQNLNNINGIRFQEIEKNTNHSMWMFGVRFLGLKTYEDAKQYFKDVGIDTRPMFYSYKRHKYLNFSGDDKVANIINNEAVIFPSYPELSDKEIDYICEKILLFTRRRLRTCQ